MLDGSGLLSQCCLISCSGTPERLQSRIWGRLNTGHPSNQPTLLSVLLSALLAAAFFSLPTAARSLESGQEKAGIMNGTKGSEWEEKEPQA